MRGRWRLTTAAVAGLLTLTACGGGSAPVDDVPALADALDQVDEAVVAGDEQAARDAVAALVDEATAAEESGDLAAADADAIVAAAQALLDRLGAEESTEESTEEPEEPVEPAPTESSEPPEEEPTEEPPEEPGPPDKPEKPPKPDKPGKGGPKPGKGPG